MASRAHPLDRATLVDKANAGLARAWEKGWLPPPDLSAEVLWERGAKGFVRADETSLRADEDIADFRARFEALVASVHTEARLNPLGRAMAYGQLTRTVRQRHQLGRLWRSEPERAATPIAPPIIIVGQMRSGTTRVHRLLAADPRHCATRFCDSWYPVPRMPDLRPVWGGMMLLIARRLDPWIDSLHPMGSTRAEEELGWLASGLGHSTFDCQWQVPSFARFCEARDATPLYREFARILRTDAAHQGNAAHPRVLKVPQFSEELDALLAQFPGARVVVARRHDEDVLRSAVSLVANQMTIQSDAVHLDWITAEWQRKLALRHDRVEAALSRFAGPVAEVHFDALGEDWEAEIAAIYAALDIDLTDAARGAMRSEMARSGKDAHHGHASDLSRFDGTGQHAR